MATNMCGRKVTGYAHALAMSTIARNGARTMAAGICTMKDGSPADMTVRIIKTNTMTSTTRTNITGVITAITAHRDKRKKVTANSRA